MAVAAALESQSSRYEGFYEGWRELVRLVRYDVRYRVRRMHQILRELDISIDDRDVLDVGFGWGDMLASFPRSCRLVGADISPSAIAYANQNTAFSEHVSARFCTISERDPEDLPRGPFDIIVSSHVLEHVPDDRASMQAMYDRLRPGGVLVAFVPVEPPDYSPIHLRIYSIQSLTERLMQTGFDILHSEGSMYAEGHAFRLISIPVRRRWPGMRYLAAAIRHVSLSAFPYPALFGIDRAMFRLGFPSCQAVVVAKR